MAGFITLPQHRNPWTEQLPQFVQQMAFQQIGQKFQEKQYAKQRQLQVESGKLSLDQAGYVEVDAEKPDVMYGGSGYKRPTNTVEIRTKDGMIYPVTTQTRYGGETKDTKIGALTQGMKPGAITHLKINDEQGKPVFVAVRQNQDGSLQEIGRGTRFKPGETNVNIDTMTKRTQGDLEADIVQGQDTLAKLDRVEELFKPEYLEYAGKGKAWLQDIGSKAGLKTGEFLAGYKKWAAEVDAHTLLWRKYITGVAGGPKEMEAIERTTINTKYDSPASFKAKSEQIRIITNAQVKRSKDLLSKGFDLEKMSPEARAAVVQQYPIENYGYKELEIPGGKPRAEYTPGKLYEDAKGDKMRFEGYDNSGKPVWGKQ